MTDIFFQGLDLAELSLWAFTLFFFGLVFYLRREDRREGYPLEEDTTGRVEQGGMLWVPEPRDRELPSGETFSVPDGSRDTRALAAKPLAVWPGAPLTPTGDPMKDGVGPAAYAERADEPDRTWEGEPKIAPLRALEGYDVAEGGPDPRGMAVMGADGKVAGVVSDVWVDRSEMLARYYEVELPAAAAAPAPMAAPDGAPAPAPSAPAAKRVLLPTPFADVRGGLKRIDVPAILARHFADVPGLKNPDQVTLLEEDKITGFYAGGLLYATPSRAEALF